MSTIAPPEPIVVIPKTARPNDLRWSIMKMIAHAERAERVANAKRVLRSRSPHVEPRHREMAASIIAGPGDLIGAKLSHDWQKLSPAEPMYVCDRCDAVLPWFNWQWCPGTLEEETTT